MPEWAITVLGMVIALTCTVFGYALAQDRRITRLEERVSGLGKQMLTMPKRKTD